MTMSSDQTDGNLLNCMNYMFSKEAVKILAALHCLAFRKFHSWITLCSKARMSTGHGFGWCFLFVCFSQSRFCERKEILDNLNIIFQLLF